MFKILISGFAIVMAMSSCDDLLNTKPLDSYSDDLIWSDYKLVEGVINNAYKDIVKEYIYTPLELDAYYGAANDDFGTEDNMVVIDPVLGDNGNLYSTMDQGLVEGMKRLVTKADIITPNFTEVSLLLGEEYKQTTTDEEIKEWVKRLSDMGPDIIVVTSVPDKEKNKTFIQQ